MKKIFLLLIVLIFALFACTGQDGEIDGHIADYAADQQSSDDAAKIIANYLADLPDIADSNVQIQGGDAIIGLDLTRKLDDAALIALKQRIVADIISKNVGISHVAVNTAPDMLEDIYHPNAERGNDEPEVKAALESNDDEEIFVNVAPTA